ncbi:MAG: translation initiation factor [Bacteroidales bacterium]|nr:translation initiation factor [Bacteroidales bacterium]
MKKTDWKSALGALTDLASSPSTSDVSSEKSETVQRRKREGVVYSTNPDFVYVDENSAEQSDNLSPRQQRLRVGIERAGRGGKTVTLVRGFVGDDEQLQQLCRQLKQRCGVGGTAKEGEIIIQGDHRARLVELLCQMGYTQTK